jgi:hypothetical protein
MAEAVFFILFITVVGLVQARLMFIRERAETLREKFDMPDEMLSFKSAHIGPIYKKEFLVKGLVPKKLLHIQRITKIDYFLIISLYIVFFAISGYIYKNYYAS